MECKEGVGEGEGKKGRGEMEEGRGEWWKKGEGERGKTGADEQDGAAGGAVECGGGNSLRARR